MVHVGWSALSVGFLALCLAVSINQALSNGVGDIDGCESFQPIYGGALLHHVYQTLKVGGEWWYDKIVGVGDISNTSINAGMLSPAFWLVRGRQLKITRSDDPQHTALLQTTGDCLGGKTFRAKITSYGDFRNGRVWAKNDCKGNCSVQYGGQFQTTDGFRQANCSGSLQSATQVGFWCDWKNADGAVLMAEEGMVANGQITGSE